MSLDFSYVNNNGKKVNGAAAFNHYVYTVKGGIENYNNEIGEEYIKLFINYNSEIINNSIQRNVSKSRFEVV